MKLKKIAGLCKASGKIMLYDRQIDGGVISQWIGDGYSVYPLDGLPYMEMEHIVSIFDLSTKQQEEMIFRHEQAPATVSFDDCADDEIMVEPEIITVIYGGAVLQAICTHDGLCYIQEKYIGPLRGDYKGVEIFRRKSESGMTYFAVKAGLMLVGIIMPHTGALNDTFALTLERMARETRREVGLNEMREVVDGGAWGGNLTGPPVDPETGEIIEEDYDE